MKIVINFLLSAIIAFIAVIFMPGLDVYDKMAAVYIALAIGVANIGVKPLLEMCSIVPTFITILLSLFFFNGAIVVFADWTLEDFSAEGTGYVILFSAVISFVNWILHRLIYK